MNCPHCHSAIPDEALFCPQCSTPLHNKDCTTDASDRSDASGATDYSYAAFISYRHLPRDTEVAKQVQKAIETYRLPKQIQTKLGSPCLGKCFRDEDELPASPSLPESISKALAQSRTLIVICTPETQDSPWIQREIEMFAALHGREHIICVLADGDSSTAIPDFLKTHMKADTQGIMHEMPAEPLAADLRTESSSKSKDELLRIIAAIAGCDFDELKQRNEKRRIKRIGITLISILALITIFSVLIYQSIQHTKEAQIEQSKNLAAIAEQQLSRGERIQAVETALSALPSSQNSTDRPLVEEAQTALEDALGVNQKSIRFWKPNFAYDANADIVAFTSSDFGDWVAILDAKGSLTVVNLYTQSSYCQLDLTKFTNNDDAFDAQEWIVKAAGKERCIVANRYGKGNIVCFNTLDGTILWEHTDTIVSALATSDDEESCVIFSARDDGSVLAGLITTQNGNALGYIETLPGYSCDLGFEPPCAYNATNHVACIAYGSHACVFSFDDGSYQPVNYDGKVLWSVQETDNLIVGTSSSNNEASDDKRMQTYYVSASDVSSNLTNKLWQHEGTYMITTAGDPYQSIAYNGTPRIQCFAYEGSLTAVCTAGSMLGVYALTDGNPIYETDFRQSVISAGTLYGAEYDNLVVVLADGTLDVIIPAGNVGAEGTAFQTQIPYQIDDASLVQKDNGLVVVLLRSANQPNRLLSYSFDAVTIDDNTTYSLDELLSQAHDLIG